MTRARCRAIVTRDGLFVAYVAALQESTTMLAQVDAHTNPSGAPHRYADLVELRKDEELHALRWEIMTELVTEHGWSIATACLFANVRGVVQLRTELERLQLIRALGPDSGSGKKSGNSDENGPEQERTG